MEIKLHFCPFRTEKWKKYGTIMKLSFFMLFVCLLPIHAVGVYSQETKVSVKNSDVSLRQLFSDIEKQSEFLFFYVDKDIEGIKVSVDVQKKPVQTVLDQALKNTNLSYSVNDRHVSIFRVEEKKSAQQNGPLISGIVTDIEGEPLIGVSIKIKNTDRGFISDYEGKFTISASPGEILVFSYIGYLTKEVVVGETKMYEIKLSEDTKMLDEVVVIGYGIQKKVNLTGAVSVVDSKKFEDRPVANAVAALQGASPGLVITRTSGQPGKEEYTAQVRGVTSVNKADVLVLIDGAPGTMSLLNPDDIESVSVLKDGTAAAIYGARAAGGVMLITTKKGKVQKARLEYSGLYSIDRIYNLPGRLHSWEDGDMENQARIANGGAPLWSSEQLGWMKDPDFNFRVSPTNPKDYEYYYDMNYIDALINKKSSSQSHTLALSGGSEKSQYRFSVGYYTKDGILKYGPDEYDRFNVRTSYIVNITDKVSLDTKIGFVNTKTLSPVADNTGRGAGGDYGILYQLFMTRSVYPFYVPNPDGTFTDHYARGTIGTMNTSLGYMKDGSQIAETNRNLDAVFTLSYAPIKGLNLRAIYAPQYNNYTYEFDFKPTYRWGINEMLDAKIDNFVEKKRRYTFQNNFQALADYDFSIKDKHQFHILGGYTLEDYRYDQISAKAQALSSDSDYSLNLGDATKNGVGDDIYEWAIMSYIGRFNYAYDDKYLFEANIRYDGSSRLAPSNRWHAFPSFSAGWNIARESWFADKVSLFDDLKFRGSWGTLGNSSVLGYYDYIALITKGSDYPFNNQRAASYYQKQLVSDKKSWEVVQTTDIGFDVSMFKRRFTLSADYFWKRTSDMLMPMTGPTTVGIELGNFNLADMKTWGWEIEGTWRDRILNNKLGYHFTFNISDNDNEVTNYGGKQIIGEGLTNIIEGKPINSIYGFVAEGLFQNQAEIDAAANHKTRNPAATKPGDIHYRDIDNSGDITVGKGTVEDHGDLVYLGNTNPRYNFGFDFGFDYGGFDFSVFFQGVGKRTMYIDAMYAMPFYESWRQPWDVHADYWREDNPGARYPRLYLGNQNRSVSSYWTQDASYIRLKNLQIGYTIPKSIISKVKIERARIYFSGQDLWEKTGMWMPYYDPESPQKSTINYPLYRSYALGLNLTF